MQAVLDDEHDDIEENLQLKFCVSTARNYHDVCPFNLLYTKVVTVIITFRNVLYFLQWTAILPTLILGLGPFSITGLVFGGVFY